MKSKFLLKFGLFQICFIIILFCIIGLRFYNFPSNPPSLNWDEVSIGYNAWSVLQTGKDEFGDSYPLIFRSLDDYKQPVYIYMTMFSIKLFGYNDFAVRFPSAFFGMLTLILFYYFLFEVSKNKYISILGMMILGILPWHFQYSRMAAETNVGLFFYLLMAFSFLKLSTSGNSKWLITSVLSMTVTTFTYLSYRVLSPLTFMVLFIFFRKSVNFKNSYTIFSLIICLILAAVMVNDTISGSGRVRFGGTSVFTHSDKYKANENQMFYDAKLKINLTRRFIHDSKIFTTINLLGHGYFSHFAPDFLFFDYGHKHHHAPERGLIFLWMILAVIYGAFKFFSSNTRSKFIILVILLISPIASSVTWDAPSALRTMTMIIPLVIFSAYGIYYLILMQKSYSGKIITIILLSIIIAVDSFWYFHQYYVHLPPEKSQIWVYGRSEMTQYLKSVEDKYDKIVVSTRLEWPYIFMLYYGKYDPDKYLMEGGTISGGFAEQFNHFDKYEFHEFETEDILNNPNTLFVGLPEEFGSLTAIDHKVNNLNEDPAIFFLSSSNNRK